MAMNAISIKRTAFALATLCLAPALMAAEKYKPVEREWVTADPAPVSYTHLTLPTIYSV